MKISVRKANPDDFHWISGELEAFEASLHYKSSFLPESSVRLNLLDKFQRHGVLLVAETPENQKVGMIAGELFQHPFNPEVTVLYEHFWWVNPEYRRTGAGDALLDAFLAESRKNEALARVSVEYNTELPPGYLERKGLRLAEKTYVMESI